MPKLSPVPQRVTVLNPDGGPARMTVTPRRRGRRTVTDVWIEQSLVDTSGGWILASRVIANDRGLPVIAEIRVFPDEPTRWVSDPLIGRVTFDPGEWGAKALGWANALLRAENQIRTNGARYRPINLSEMGLRTVGTKSRRMVAGDYVSLHL